MTHRRRSRSIRPFLVRFGADRTGATAVEFAIIALPFFALLIAIIQTSLIMFGSQALQSMTSQLARQIMTGEIRTPAAFKTALCNSNHGMFDCNKVMFEVDAYTSFGAASSALFQTSEMAFTPACFTLDPPPSGPACYNSGLAQHIVIVRIAYDWPFSIDFENLDHKTRITAFAAFRNEPFP